MNVRINVVVLPDDSAMDHAGGKANMPQDGGGRT